MFPQAGEKTGVGTAAKPTLTVAEDCPDLAAVKAAVNGSALPEAAKAAVLALIAACRPGQGAGVLLKGGTGGRARVN